MSPRFVILLPPPLPGMVARKTQYGGTQNTDLEVALGRVERRMPGFAAKDLKLLRSFGPTALVRRLVPAPGLDG